MHLKRGGGGRNYVVYLSESTTFLQYIWKRSEFRRTYFSLDKQRYHKSGNCHSLDVLVLPSTQKAIGELSLYRTTICNNVKRNRVLSPSRHWLHFPNSSRCLREYTRYDVNRHLVLRVLKTSLSRVCPWSLPPPLRLCQGGQVVTLLDVTFYYKSQTSICNWTVFD